MNRGGSWNQRGRGGRRGKPRGSGGMHNYGDNRFDGRDGGLTERSTGSGGGGPLATGHLQLRDLDLELALLKRKRELIEKQQNMLKEPPFGGSNRFNYEEPVARFDRDRFGASGQMRQFSELYPERGSGAKRRPPQGEPEAWSAPTKRPRRRPPPHTPTSDRGDSAVRPKYSDRFTPKDHSDFRPTKVTKNKPSSPNKLHSYPVADRKSLIDRASRSTGYPPETEVYEPKKPTSSKVVGRLELALGNVLKEMRLAHGQEGPFVANFQSSSFQRALKQALRERIRTVMSGLVVGSCSEIVILYREKFPQDTDVDLLNKIVFEMSIDQSKPNIAIELIQSANASTFFEFNFKRILHESLDKMLKKLHDIYVNDGNRKSADIYDNLLSAFSGAKVVNDKSENVEMSVVSQDVESKTTENAEAAAEDGGNDVSITENTEQSAEIAEKDHKVEETDSKTEVIDDKPQVIGKSEEIKNMDGETDNKVGEIDDKAGNDEKTAEAADESIEMADQTQKEDSEDAIISALVGTKEFTPEHLKGSFYSRLVERLLRRLLPSMLPKYKKMIVNIIALDPEFQSAKQYVMEKALENTTKSEIKTTQTFNKQLFYVKVVGRPRLPPKSLMTEFLNMFAPVSIKKHKAANNILFVGFGLKENFDRILAENGTKIGNMKLDIKVSEKIIKKPNSNADANNSIENVTKDDNKSIKSGDLPLDDNLSDQINDLLTTIRQEEEKKNETNTENAQVQDSVESDNSTLKLDDSVKNEEVKNDSQNKNNATDENADNGNQNANKDVIEIDEDAGENGPNGEKKDVIEIDIDADENNEEMKDVVNKELKEVKNDLNQQATTPTRSSTRLAATPRNVTTRRSSKLGQN